MVSHAAASFVEEDSEADRPGIRPDDGDGVRQRGRHAAHPAERPRDRRGSVRAREGSPSARAARGPRVGRPARATAATGPHQQQTRRHDGGANSTGGAPSPTHDRTIAEPAASGQGRRTLPPSEFRLPDRARPAWPALDPRRSARGADLAAHPAVQPPRPVPVVPTNLPPAPTRGPTIQLRWRPLYRVPLLALDPDRPPAR